MKCFLKIIGIGFGGVVVLGLSLVAARYWRISNPIEKTDIELPDTSVSFESDRGQKLLSAASSADHSSLSDTFKVQQKASWCGVASAVTVLNANGASLTQNEFFTDRVTDVRPWLATTFTGMPIGDLAQMLEVHGVNVEVKRARSSTLEAFRDSLKSNMSDSSNWLIVNYGRSELGEEGGGHISPISAYSSKKDMALILDTAGYKYPFHWVPVDSLFEAMETSDSETGKSRGWVVVR
jgi:hypothetical protein